MAETAVQLRKISVRGVVQGVGFRPFVYRLAHDHELRGWVLNHSGGVDIEVEGQAPSLDAFVRALSGEAPPLARIVGVDVEEAPPQGYAGFEIRHSIAEEGRYQLISPDIATCADCRRELMDPADRRYRYPFTNCTNCGPRFTIIQDIPYDRPLTTMRPFSMCHDCQREYDDPLDRRFHAQPNGCPVCGPQVWLEENGPPGATLADRDEALHAAVRMLQGGKVLAVKGLGGYHLACDATNEAAVQSLRSRKGRPAKPLAVMMSTLDEVRSHCDVSPEEERLLTSQQCPIVLLRWRDDSRVVRPVAPGNRYLGVMLPYTPLHHVLLRDAGRPLVMTSGNLSEEPIAQGNDEARRRLGPLCDALLMHNRDIYARYDDSVWLVPEYGSSVEEQDPAQPVRRSRGYAPFPVRLPFQAGQILATGAELKNTFCITRDDFAFLSQHIGDMENLETLEHFEEAVGLYQHLYRVEPELVAYDLHPGYSAAKYAQNLIQEAGPESALRGIGVQHHQAHIAACLVDNAWGTGDGPVIGVAFDGTGYGLDEKIWGGEFLVGEYHGFRRAAHLEYLPLPGGDTAVFNPWRLALSYVYSLTGQVLDLPGVSEQEACIVLQQVDRGLNTPLTSAAGRLFDAVAALLGVRCEVTYEAQAAIELEMLASSWRPTSGDSRIEPYGYHLEGVEGTSVIRLQTMIQGILRDLSAGLPAAEIGARFHLSLAAVIADMCQRIAAETGLQTVALSGGCFQNRLLLALGSELLEEAGFTVLTHHQVPCNDGGISLGQAALAHFAAEEERLP